MFFVSESDCDNNDTFFNELNDDAHDSSSSEVISEKSGIYLSLMYISFEF